VRTLLCAGITALTLSLLPTAAGAGEGPFLHEQMLRLHADRAPLGAADVTPPTTSQLAHRARGTSPVVMGYLPYWVSANELPWEHLDVVAWFSAEMNGDGSLGDTHGWGGSGSDALISAAHQAGAIVVLSTTRFGGSNLAELLGNPTARSNAIDNLVAAMLDGGGDGLDIDFEGLELDNRDDLVDFIIALRAAMDTAQPGSHLSLATPAVDWDGAYDYDVLANHSDLLFVMGYAFAGSWSNPKPNAPLEASDQWGSRSLQWSARDYIQWAGIENAPGIILGLPLYGNTWDAASAELGSTATGSHSSTFYASCQERFAQYGRNWDSDSSTPWTAWNDGGQWQQLWCEDEVSIAMKAQMALDEGLGGFGFWALNYDEGDELLWQTVTDLLGGPGGGDDDDSSGDDDDSSGDGDSTAPAGDDDDDDRNDGGRSGCTDCQGSLSGAAAAPTTGTLLAAVLWMATARRRRCR